MDNLKSYALKSSYFIITKLSQWLDRIDNIILFGSIAQERGDEKSDVDLFFDTSISEKQMGKLRLEIKEAISEFRLSEGALKFKLKGIYNEINFSVGKLSEWKDLYRSVSATGIVLYGKYKTAMTKTDLSHYAIIFWEGSGGNRGAFLNKLYGYKIEKKMYKGMIETFGGIKIGKSAMLIPIIYKEKFYHAFDKYKIQYRIIEVFAAL